MELILFACPASFQILFLEALQYSGTKSAPRVKWVDRITYRRRVHQNVIEIVTNIATKTDPIMILRQSQDSVQGKPLIGNTDRYLYAVAKSSNHFMTASQLLDLTRIILLN